MTDGSAGRPDALARRLGTGDAVVIGLGSMIGAGVFAAFAPAAQAAGSALLVGLGIAALVAYANATSSAQLAAQYPTSGGTYVYGREQLGPWWGYLAGWCFVVGKTASCAAMALTFAAYAAPDGWERPVAAAAVVVALAAGDPRWSRLGEDWSAPLGPAGVLQSAGLLFFAFAGYARIATMGEEVRDPARTIPRAIQLALGVAVAVYAVVALVLLTVLGPDGTAATDAPLAVAVAVAGSGWADVVVRVGAAAASLGALLALVAGVGRTALAMARERDLPSWLAAVHPRYRVPHHAEVALAVVVVVLVLTVDLRDAIGFSSFGVLLYYLVANLAAWRQDAPHRRFPRALALTGALGCVVLVVTLPTTAVLAGVVVLAVGVAYRLWRLARRRSPLS